MNGKKKQLVRLLALVMAIMLIGSALVTAVLSAAYI